jgi:hypothetical protein
VNTTSVLRVSLAKSSNCRLFCHSLLSFLYSTSVHKVFASNLFIRVKGNVQILVLCAQNHWKRIFDSTVLLGSSIYQLGVDRRQWLSERKRMRKRSVLALFWRLSFVVCFPTTSLHLSAILIAGGRRMSLSKSFGRAAANWVSRGGLSSLNGTGPIWKMSLAGGPQMPRLDV